jgi:hypothetical protein
MAATGHDRPRPAGDPARDWENMEAARHLKTMRLAKFYPLVNPDGIAPASAQNLRSQLVHRHLFGALHACVVLSFLHWHWGTISTAFSLYSSRFFRRTT